MNLRPIYKVFILACSSMLSPLLAQHHCGTDEFYQEQLNLNPSLKVVENQYNEECKSQVNSVQFRASIYTIPVVFHVIHTNGPENISREQILDQLRVLNEDFNKKNANIANLRSAFTSRAADCQIAFELAKVDPNGNCTDGVNRIYSSAGVETSMTSEPVKQLIYWDKNKYLNIWVVSSIAPSGGGSGTVLGYAVFPWMNNRDGVVVRHDRVGSIGTAASTDGGRTLTHEVGHWLGLYHTFQDGCTGGDQCDDTPPVNGTFTNASCPANGNSCSNDSPDLPDMWENFMDYSDGKCMSAFTTNQRSRMHYFLGQTPRKNLVTSSNLTATGVVNSNVAPKGLFNADKRVVCAGDAVQFYDLSCKGGPTVWSWSLPGSSSPNSSQKDPKVIYQTPGTYKVSLTVQNNYGSNSYSQDAYITVLKANGDNQAHWEENFESADPFSSGAFAHSSPSGSQFSYLSTVGFSGTYSIKAPIITNTGVGKVYSFTTPSFDFTSLGGQSPRLTFYVSYAQPSADVSETLRVFISTDCGGSFTQILERSGSALSYTGATYASNFVPSASNQWKLSGIPSLNSLGFGSATNAMFRFDVVSSGGNPVYLDNINCSPWYAGTENTEWEELSIYPNPSDKGVTIRYDAQHWGPNVELTVWDAQGRLCEKINATHWDQTAGVFQLDRNQIPESGVYFAELKSDTYRVRKPFVLIP
ncbi:MAG: M43 family zinc metalloprotease [Bacteroidetes bacterium]|nr:M43 family zinc metalloprotease [Bacteroidota bacterium]MDA0943914.1 M43 family zinc metalloprotease [Bacteroidota bacterium]MDA1112095.1 M43 family zinc metalloprotease [Bacteroidota bacterium]